MPLLSLAGADVLLISAHKFGGAKGVGAMLVSSPRVELCASHMKGGGQEARRRSGTENIAGIHAMGVALAQALNDNFSPMRDIFEKALDKKFMILGQFNYKMSLHDAFAVVCMTESTSVHMMVGRLKIL